MDDVQGKIGTLDLNPALEHLRGPASNLCWWCGGVATTEEHRINPGIPWQRQSLTDLKEEKVT
ncbi:hypothetical protein ACF046_14765 [Glutamicibacter creatinolyticus]|uniref:hypothetical protein n=1 Tax=Glutamicibacter creatinolyticus TaxID=162496 RepID=UPI0033CE6CE1